MGAAGHADSKSSAPRSPQAPPPADPEAPTLLDAVIDSTRAPAGGSPDASPDPAADAPTVLVGPPTFTGARTTWNAVGCSSAAEHKPAPRGSPALGVCTENLQEKEASQRTFCPEHSAL